MIMCAASKSKVRKQQATALLKKEKKLMRNKKKCANKVFSFFLVVRPTDVFEEIFEPILQRLA
jgi:hypothetical protein